mgnify:CR=1 FL=1
MPSETRAADSLLAASPPRLNPVIQMRRRRRAQQRRGEVDHRHRHQRRHRRPDTQHPAPVLAAIYVAEVSLAAFDRIAPGLGLADAGPAVRWTSGLLGLIVSAPLLAGVVADQGMRAVQAIEAAFRLLAG